MSGARVIVTDSQNRLVGIALFSPDGMAARADLAPLRALAIGRRLIEAAEHALLETAAESRCSTTTSAVLAEVGL